MTGYDGECLVTRIDDPVEGTKLRIDRADQRIRIAAELIAEVETDGLTDTTISDGVLRIVGVNRTVAYRIGELDGVGPVAMYRAERVDES